MAVLQRARDAKGRALIVHKIPIPGPLHASDAECAGVVALDGSQLRDPSIRLAGSYVNFLIVNGGIIAPPSAIRWTAKPSASCARCSRARRGHGTGPGDSAGRWQHPLHHPAATGALRTLRANDAPGRWPRQEGPMDFLVNLDVDDLERGVGFTARCSACRSGADSAGSPWSCSAGRRPSTCCTRTPAALRRPRATSTAITDATGRRCIWTSSSRISSPSPRRRWPWVRGWRSPSRPKLGPAGVAGRPFGHGFCLIQFLGRGYDERLD